MIDSKKQTVPGDDNSNQLAGDTSFEIEVPTKSTRTPTINQNITEASRIAFALGRLGRILIDIARNPKSQQTETDSKN